MKPCRVNSSALCFHFQQPGLASSQCSGGVRRLLVPAPVPGADRGAEGGQRWEGDRPSVTHRDTAPGTGDPCRDRTECYYCAERPVDFLMGCERGLLVMLLLPPPSTFGQTAAAAAVNVWSNCCCRHRHHHRCPPLPPLLC